MAKRLKHETPEQSYSKQPAGLPTERFSMQGEPATATEREIYCYEAFRSTTKTVRPRLAPAPKAPLEKESGVPSGI